MTAIAMLNDYTSSDCNDEDGIDSASVDSDYDIAALTTRDFVAPHDWTWYNKDNKDPDHVAGPSERRKRPRNMITDSDDDDDEAARKTPDSPSRPERRAKIVSRSEVIEISSDEDEDDEPPVRAPRPPPPPRSPPRSPIQEQDYDEDDDEDEDDEDDEDYEESSSSSSDNDDKPIKRYSRRHVPSPPRFPAPQQHDEAEASDD